MNIGIFTHNYPKSINDRKNAGIFIYDFASELSKKHNVYIFCPDDFKEKMGDWKIFDPRSLFNFLKLFIKVRHKALNFAKNNKLDICLAAWSIPSGIYTYYINKKLKIPYAVWSLGSDINKYANYPILKDLIKKVLINANMRFANSYLLCNKVNKLTNKKCIFLPAVTKFDKAIVEKDKLLFTKNNKFKFLFVGRLEKIKGPDILVNAAKLLLKQNDNFEINIIGNGTMYNLLNNKVNKYGLNKNIKFIGWANEKKLKLYMSKSDFLIVPSRNESLPLVIFEASSLKLPIISTNVGECKKIINKYNIGMIIEKENPVALANAMNKAILNKKAMIDLYKEGFDLIAKDFNVNRSINTFLSEINKYI